MKLSEEKSIDTRLAHCIKNSGLSPEEFARQTDNEILRYPNLGLKSLKRLRAIFGGPPLNPALSQFSDQELLDEWHLREAQRRRLTDHG